MIKEIKVKENSFCSDVLLFNKIENLKKLNILFGGNGAGKSTLLKNLNNNKVIELKSSKELIFVNYTNSEDNFRLKNIMIRETEDILNTCKSRWCSEGQSIIYNILKFIKKVKHEADNNENKIIVVTIDEMDSGLSTENINFLLNIINEELLKGTDNVQLFISSNHYHFVYCFKNVINMYDGEWIEINSYEEFFELLNKGITIMNKNKNDIRTYDFLEY